jgi:branched-chain amino acid transport system substrate-binding protein
MLVEDGVGTVQPVCRKDAGNQGLCSSVSERFQAGGGELLPAIEYDPGAAMSDVLLQVQEAVDGDPEAAIYLAAFEEAVELFSLAASAGALSDVSWYGSDGMALNAALVAPDNQPAAEFAAEVNYPNPIFGLDSDAAASWQPIFDQVKTAVGYDPDAFALSTYDALNIAVDAYIDAGGTDGIEAYKDAFVERAATNDSISGPTELNEAGDRRTAVFDFWAVRSGSDGRSRAGSRSGRAPARAWWGIVSRSLPPSSNARGSGSPATADETTSPRVIPCTLTSFGGRSARGDHFL